MKDPRLTKVTTPDDQPIESQHSAHNKPPMRATRIRMSWIVILVIFLMLGFTAVMIMNR
jgi:uncharacterized integral membrane protein